MRYRVLDVGVLGDGTLIDKARVVADFAVLHEAKTCVMDLFDQGAIKDNQTGAILCAWTGGTWIEPE